jgi:hypothetical protein
MPGNKRKKKGRWEKEKRIWGRKRRKVERKRGDYWFVGLWTAAVAAVDVWLTPIDGDGVCTSERESAGRSTTMTPLMG